MDQTPPVNAIRSNLVDDWLRRLSLRLVPPRCLLCFGPGVMGHELCADCARELPWNRSCCARCALPLPATEPAVSTRVCGRCLRRPPNFDRLLAPFRYADPIDGLIIRFKFHRDLAAGVLLADLIAAARLDDPWPRPDLLVPVPLHRQRLRERGFDQALELAKRLAPALGIPLARDALIRSRATAAQSELDAKQRRRNVRDAFVAASNPVRGRRIALLDDVATTTATAQACTRALRAAGARWIEVWAVARAPIPATG